MYISTPQKINHYPTWLPYTLLLRISRGYISMFRWTWDMTIQTFMALGYEDQVFFKYAQPLLRTYALKVKVTGRARIYTENFTSTSSRKYSWNGDNLKEAYVVCNGFSFSASWYQLSLPVNSSPITEENTQMDWPWLPLLCCTYYVQHA